MTNSLFSIRVRNLLKKEKKEDNFYLLSGLLIGDELAYLARTHRPVFLAAANPILEMYQLGLTQILPSEQLTFFDEKTLETAFLTGQRKILELYAQ